MARIISYSGSVVVRGVPTDFDDGLDPQHWSDNHPWIWPQSYMVQKGARVVDRDQDPPAQAKMSVPLQGPFFEQVRMGPFLYDNVLSVEYLRSRGAGGIQFRYRQDECLKTTDIVGQTMDGGIDVDNGVATCDIARANQSFVRIIATKNVRFTEPGAVVDSAVGGFIFEVAVKMGMDALLHSVLF